MFWQFELAEEILYILENIPDFADKWGVAPTDVFLNRLLIVRSMYLKLMQEKNTREYKSSVVDIATL